MEWIFAALIMAAIVYAGLILVELTNYSMRMLPRINQSTERAERLAESYDREAEDCSIANDRKMAAKISVSELNEGLTGIREQIRSEGGRKQRLEMEYFKSRVRSRKPAMA